MLEFVESNADLKAYFGLFEKKSEKFHFMIGDKQLILALVEIVKEIPLDIWRLSKQSQIYSNEPSKVSNNEPSLTKAKLAVDKTNLQKNVLFQSNQSVKELCLNVNLEAERKKVEMLIKNLSKKYIK